MLSCTARAQAIAKQSKDTRSSPRAASRSSSLVQNFGSPRSRNEPSHPRQRSTAGPWRLVIDRSFILAPQQNSLQKDSPCVTATRPMLLVRCLVTTDSAALLEVLTSH